LIRFSYSDNSLNDTLPLRSTDTTRRFRSSFTSKQIEILEEFFSHTPYPDVTTRDNLSQRLNIEGNRIQTWFSNRRARNKKTTTYSSTISTPPSINDEENTIPSFLPSPVIDMKSLSINDNVFDPTITSSPSISMFELY
jgi:hypothetical protein